MRLLQNQVAFLNRRAEITPSPPHITAAYVRILFPLAEGLWPFPLQFLFCFCFSSHFKKLTPILLSGFCFYFTVLVEDDRKQQPAGLSHITAGLVSCLGLVFHMPKASLLVPTLGFNLIICIALWY